jgi:hypothetical protein
VFHLLSEVSVVKDFVQQLRHLIFRLARDIVQVRSLLRNISTIALAI